MSTEEAELRKGVMLAVQETSNDDTKLVLLYLLRLLDVISEKIDGVVANETKLRETVLNGHAKNHDSDHEWVGEQRAADGRHEADHAWVGGKRKEEEVAGASARNIRDGVIINLLNLVAGSALGTFGTWLLLR